MNIFVGNIMRMFGWIGLLLANLAGHEQEELAGLCTTVLPPACRRWHILQILR